MCLHLTLVDGFGGMGDALICVNCGLCKYPEVFPSSWIAYVLGRVYKEGDPQYEELSKKALEMRAIREQRED